ncbi:intermembrane transport protein PqiB [Neisseria sp. Ec49-e6-T10]|uniref:intermembrane transport protein PqiB n=1 Tax=Neisseria sp. Ec49-e6-T10 TaxID=3140744 RepID=UPI003EBFE9DF
MAESKKAIVSPNRLVSLVWLVPVIALFIGIWMLIETVQQRGPEITLYMDSAEGIEVNKTVIRVLSVEVGRVTEIRLNKAENGVEVIARLNADSENLLKTDTQFWVVKPRIDQGGITGLGTLLSGAYIEFSPGHSQTPSRAFTVLASPPITASNKSGLRLQLESQASKLIPVGNPVLYRDVIVGRIEVAQFNPKDKKVHYQIFIDKPYDQLVKSNMRFWITSGIDIQTTPEGLKLRSGALPTLLGGGISFGLPEGQNEGSAVQQNARFVLFADVDRVKQSPSERSIYYVVFFDQSIRGLAPDSPVEFQGIRVGSVVQLPYFEKDKSLHMLQERSIPVLIRLEPDRMEINAQTQSEVFWKEQIQNSIKKGLVAKLQSNSLLTGTLFIDLSLSDTTTQHSALAQYNQLPVIPSQGAGLAKLEDQISALLNKLNSLPLESSVQELNGTLKEVHQLTASLNKIASQSETQNLPNELNKTLRSLQSTLKGVSPDSPIYSEIKDTLNTLNQTLDQVQPVVRTLNEQPNALIFNKSVKDPIPKGK